MRIGEGAVTWKRMCHENGLVAVNEGEDYLFAVRSAVGWCYFSDSVTWDSETPPYWNDGGHGWPIDDDLWFTDMPMPPEGDES